MAGSEGVETYTSSQGEIPDLYTPDIFLEAHQCTITILPSHLLCSYAFQALSVADEFTFVLEPLNDETPKFKAINHMAFHSEMFSNACKQRPGECFGWFL